LALIVENGGWGTTAAAPIARKVFDFWLAPERVAARLAVEPAEAYQPAITVETGEEEVGGESPDAVVAPEDLPPVNPDQENGNGRGVLPTVPQPSLRLQLRS